MLRTSLTVAVAAAAVLASAPTASASYTCDAIAKRTDMDPAGQFFNNRFRDPIAVNALGDTLFTGRPIGSREKLYFYPNGGAPEILGQVYGAAPNGGTYTPNKTFEHLSLNDSGDLGFCGGTGAGRS